METKPTTYSAKVLDHFTNPRNVGVLEGENVAVGRVGNPVCGDLMEIYVQVEDDRLKDVKFRTFGCGSAIATSSMITEMVKGKTLDEAMKVSRQDVAGELDGLPPIKMHCSNLAADALHEAIKNYRENQGQVDTAAPAPPKEGFSGVIDGELEHAGKGVFYSIDNPERFKDQRIMVLDTSESAVDAAKDLIRYTGRVVFLTSKPEKLATEEIKSAKQAGVKVLFESEPKAIIGHDEVEGVLIHDINEDIEYDLIIDAVIILRDGCQRGCCGSTR